MKLHREVGHSSTVQHSTVRRDDDKTPVAPQLQARVAAVRPTRQLVGGYPSNKPDQPAPVVGETLSQFHCRGSTEAAGGRPWRQRQTPGHCWGRCSRRRPRRRRAQSTKGEEDGVASGVEGAAAPALPSSGLFAPSSATAAGPVSAAGSDSPVPLRSPARAMHVRSSSTSSLHPECVAAISAVRPNSSHACVSAPASSSTRATSACPPAAARTSGGGFTLGEAREQRAGDARRANFGGGCGDGVVRVPASRSKSTTPRAPAHACSSARRAQSQALSVPAGPNDRRMAEAAAATMAGRAGVWKGRLRRPSDGGGSDIALDGEAPASRSCATTAPASRRQSGVSSGWSR